MRAGRGQLAMIRSTKPKFDVDQWACITPDPIVVTQHKFWETCCGGSDPISGTVARIDEGRPTESEGVGTEGWGKFYLFEQDRKRASRAPHRITKELAGELGMDEIELSDELITLDGKIPSDLAETLSRNPEVIPIFSAPVTPTSPSRPPSAPRSTRTPGPRCTAPHRGRSRARSRGG